MREWQARIKAVERERDALRLAADDFLRAAQRDSSLLPATLQVRDLRRAGDRLDGTYIVRLFAEFEAALREFKRATKPASRQTRTEHLLNIVAAARRIPNDRLAAAHRVREFRNAFVHDHDDAVTVISVRDARADLCHFLSFLPQEW